MPNNYFQFKAFTIYQEHCAMKVSTDSCIFGALVAETFGDIELQQLNLSGNYLDIGTGTGLLSLMLAQKSSGLIDAVEIDNAAFAQAENNFNVSIFKAQLSIYNKDILAFDAGKKYAGIMCNPPFFEGDLKSVNQQKNLARHDNSLTLAQLMQFAVLHLQQQGLLAILLPYHRLEIAIETALKLNLHLTKKILLQHSLQHPYFRGILFFSLTNNIATEQILVIKNAEGTYSPEFTALLKDYYLHL